MTSYVFESWMMSLNVHFKSLKHKVLLGMDNSITHSLKHVGRDESFIDRLVCQRLSNIIIASYHLMLQVRYNPWIME